MLKWVDRVWRPFAEAKEGPSLLFLDKAHVHLTVKVCYQIALLNTELEIIPEGYTSKLQVMDVGLNKQFKTRVHNGVEEFILNEPVGSKPNRKSVSKWIRDA